VFVVLYDDIYMEQKNVFISYNIAGDLQRGAVDWLDLSEPRKPKLVSHLDLLHHDANAIYKSGDYVYVAGAADTGGASLIRITIKNQRLSDQIETYALPSYAGTDITANSKSLFVTSGNTGGLSIIDKESMKVVSYTEIHDARSLSIDTSEKMLRVLGGTNGLITVFDLSGAKKTEVKVGGASIPESKSTIESGAAYTTSALGDGGVKLTCNSSNQEVASIAQVQVPKIDPKLTVTNSASSAAGMIFSANGEAGVYVYSMMYSAFEPATCKPIRLNFAGQINFGSRVSANQVYVYGNPFEAYLLVADGLGGTQIVQVQRLFSVGSWVIDRENENDNEANRDPSSST
jgi:hypothetical protein